MSHQHYAARWPVLTLAALAVVLLGSSALARQVAPDAPSQSVSSASAYERLQQLARQLESLAHDTKDRAKLDERRGGREEVTDEMDDFADHASEFRRLIQDRGVPASTINDRIRQLLDAGREVQNEWARSQSRNPETQAAWNQTLAALNRLNDQFMQASGLAAPSAVGTSGSSTTWVDTRTRLLGDLDRRLDSAINLSRQSYATQSGQIEALRNQLRLYTRSANELSASDAHGRIAAMLADARTVQRQMSNASVPAQLRDDVDAVVGTLVYMLDLGADPVTGTSGITTPASDSDRYAAMGPSELSLELGNRATRASDIAAGGEFEDVSKQIDDFRDRLRDYNANAAAVDREERRDRLDSLLRDAQRTQHDLARRNVPASLVTEWNAVVDLLVRLRDAT